MCSQNCLLDFFSGVVSPVFSWILFLYSFLMFFPRFVPGHDSQNLFPDVFFPDCSPDMLPGFVTQNIYLPDFPPKHFFPWCLFLDLFFSGIPPDISLDVFPRIAFHFFWNLFPGHVFQIFVLNFSRIFGQMFSPAFVSQISSWSRSPFFSPGKKRFVSLPDSFSGILQFFPEICWGPQKSWKVQRYFLLPDYFSGFVFQNHYPKLAIYGQGGPVADKK